MTGPVGQKISLGEELELLCIAGLLQIGKT